VTKSLYIIERGREGEDIHHFGVDGLDFVSWRPSPWGERSPWFRFGYL
jgi:hypothetical protein